MRRRQRLAHRLRTLFGLTMAQYDAMLAAQKGRCAICHECERVSGEDGTPVRLAVDHDHKTGLVRGLLCRSCNGGLGFMQDDPLRLLAAASYLLNRRGR
jgi:hypothetical protein